MVLVCVGRRPYTDDLNLEVGAIPDQHRSAMDACLVVVVVG